MLIDIKNSSFLLCQPNQCFLKNMYMLQRKFTTNVFRVLYIFVVVVRRNKTKLRIFCFYNIRMSISTVFLQKKTVINKHKVYLSCRKTKQNKCLKDYLNEAKTNIRTYRKKILNEATQTHKRQNKQ